MVNLYGKGAKAVKARLEAQLAVPSAPGSLGLADIDNISQHATLAAWLSR